MNEALRSAQALTESKLGGSLGGLLGGAANAVLPGFGTTSHTTNQQLNASHTWTLNPTMVNEFRFTYFRVGQGEFMHPQRTHLVTDSCTAAASARNSRWREMALLMRPPKKPPIQPMT